jgi:hypothetical protein
MAGDRGGHSQPRIGVDIGRADEAFHQLVGDVIVLGQELAGEIEGDRVGAIAVDDALESVGDAVERVGPGNAREADPPSERLIELNDHDLRRDPSEQRKATLAMMLARAAPRRQATSFSRRRPDER